MVENPLDQKRTSIYLIGSLRNPKIPEIANEIRTSGIEVFDDWFAPGKDCDEYWMAYEKQRGKSYGEALDSWAAKHIFEFDKFHLDRTDGAVLVMPAGKSAHLELGYTVGRGKPGYILFDEEPSRWDVMTLFATRIFSSMDKLMEELNALNRLRVKSEAGKESSSGKYQGVFPWMLEDIRVCDRAEKILREASRQSGSSIPERKRD